MKKLQLNMLLNTCQNQWRSVISRNPNFKCLVFGPNGYIMTLDAKYQENKQYYEYRENEVAFWEMTDKDTLRVELTW